MAEEPNPLNDDMSKLFDLLDEEISTPPPAAEPVKEPIIEPIVEPIVEPAVEPIVDPIVEPVREPVEDPIVEPVDELKRLEGDNAWLRGEIDRLSGARAEKVAREVGAAPKKLELKEVDFLGETGELSMDSAESLNKKLNAVYKRAVEDGVRAALEQVGDVDAAINKRLSLYDMVTEFYEGNPDLKQFKRAVTGVAEELMDTDEKMTFSKLFTVLGDECRKRLRVHNKQAPAKGQQPGLPSVGSGGRAASTVGKASGKQSDIDALFSGVKDRLGRR